MATTTIPELRAALDATTVESERLAALLALVQTMFYNDGREALLLADEALELARRLNDGNSTARAMMWIGVMHVQSGNYHEAIRHLERASLEYEKVGNRSGLAQTMSTIAMAWVELGESAKALEQYESARLISEGGHDLRVVARITMNIGNLYTALGDNPRALEQYRSALQIAEQAGDRASVAGVAGNIGTIYQQLGEYAKALERHQFARALFEELGDRADVAIATGNIGNTYQQLGEYAKALEHHQLAIVESEEVGDRQNVGRLLGDIGGIYRQLGDYSRAIDQYNAALALFEEIGNRKGVVGVTGALGSVYAQEEFEAYNPRLAEKYLLRSIELATEMGQKGTLQRSHLELSVLYRQQGMWQQAHEHLGRSHELKEELNSIEAHRKVQQIEHLRQIAEMEKRRALERAEEQAQLEALSLHAQLLEAQLDRQRAELASQAMHLARQTEMLGLFRNDLRAIMRDGGDPLATVRQIREKLKELPCEAIDWTKFNAEFRQTYPEFQSKLLERYPELTGMEMKVCALLKLHLTSADIAKLLCLSERSVEGHRLRIRKKMGLVQGEDVHTVLAGI